MVWGTFATLDGAERDMFHLMRGAELGGEQRTAKLKFVANLYASTDFLMALSNTAM